MSADVWMIALAAGAGRRLAPLTGGTPKQFWRRSSKSRSLLETTLLRLRPLAVPERTVTVVDASHRVFVESLPTVEPLGDLVYQPMDRGTAPGVLLPLARVLALAPDAIVIITPTDHGVSDTDAFHAGIRDAISRVRSGLSEIVLFGVEPTAVTEDYGWITPSIRGEFARGVVQAVAGFVEKPSLFHAFQLFSAGAVWNTMVLVAKASALLSRYRRHLPFLADVFDKAAELDAKHREAFLAEWYPDLPRADFSRDLLMPTRPLCLFTWPAEIGWSDLGTPERLNAWLAEQEPDAGDRQSRMIAPGAGLPFAAARTG
jgi:mannose-1-phosphate guanylyltransferase